MDPVIRGPCGSVPSAVDDLPAAAIVSVLSLTAGPALGGSGTSDKPWDADDVVYTDEEEDVLSGLH